MDAGESKGKGKMEDEGASPVGKSAPTQADVSGSTTAWVRPLEDCPHLASAALLKEDQVPAVTDACKDCGDGLENWGCLSCGHVYCGRYINGHMLRHHEGTRHPLAVGFSDLSVWCFRCEQYLNGLTNRKLRPIVNALHCQKFGEPIPEGRFELRLGS